MSDSLCCAFSTTSVKILQNGRRQSVVRQRLCLADLNSGNDKCSLSSPGDSAMEPNCSSTDINCKEKPLNQNSFRNPVKSVPDLSSTADETSEHGLRRHGSVSGFKSRRWSFSSRRPSSLTSNASTLKGKQSLRRRNSIESKAQNKPSPSGTPEGKRLQMRRGALWNPELMPMPQNVREKVEKDVNVRRKSMKRRLSNFLAIRLDLDKEVDLF